MLALRELLQKKSRESARAYRERIWLLSAILDKSQGTMFMEQDLVLNPKQYSQYLNAIKRRKKGEPLQYIVGHTEFWGRKFAVQKGILIPRPETERLVEIALEKFGDGQLRILDVGTGSGVIASTLALERPGWKISASDISESALLLAKKNAKNLRAKVKFQRANLLDFPIRLKNFDWIISNPPYLEFERDKITAEVLRSEPRLALEPTQSLRVGGVERAAWAAERILRSAAVSRLGRGVLLELSPRIALYIERKWRKHSRVERIERLADLTGRKRFLLITWKTENVKNG